MLRGKSVILMAFPDAIEFLHRLGVCTIDKDDIVPPIQAEVAVASDAVQGAIMGQDVVPAATSDAMQGVIMPQNAILAPLRAPFVLPDNAFIVSSRNDSMYGKRMRDVHIAGYLVQSETVIRFRKRDHKVMPADMMVGVGKYDTYTNANRAVQNFMRKNDDKVSDLTSMEVDKTLSIEQVKFFCTVIESWYKNIFNKRIVCTHSYVKRYKLFI